MQYACVNMMLLMIIIVLLIWKIVQKSVHTACSIYFGKGDACKLNLLRNINKYTLSMLYGYAFLFMYFIAFRDAFHMDRQRTQPLYFNFKAKISIFISFLLACTANIITCNSPTQFVTEKPLPFLHMEWVHLFLIRLMNNSLNGLLVSGFLGWKEQKYYCMK